MRTVKRKALPPNAKKQTDLEGLCQAYTREKQRWLQHFQCWKRQPYLERPRTLRDEMVKQGYRSPNQLQARHWKLALNDAAETWDKYWQSIFVKVRLKISHRKDLIRSRTPLCLLASKRLFPVFRHDAGEMPRATLCHR